MLKYFMCSDVCRNSSGNSEIKSPLEDIFFLNYSNILYGVTVWVFLHINLAIVCGLRLYILVDGIGLIYETKALVL